MEVLKACHLHDNFNGVAIIPSGCGQGKLIFVGV